VSVFFGGDSPHKIIPPGKTGIAGSTHPGKLFPYPEAIQLRALRSEDLLDVGEVLATKEHHLERVQPAF